MKRRLLFIFLQYANNKIYLLLFIGLNWRTTLTIIEGTASAIQKLHRQNPPLIYRDLNLNNILLDKVN